MPSVGKFFKLNKYTLVINILFLSFLVTRLVFLGKDITNTDAYRWHDRSQKFLIAVKNLDFKSTYQHYQPGVTLMWLNSAVKQFSFSYQYHILKNQQPLTLENADFYPTIHGLSKAAIIVVLFLLLIIQYQLVKKVFNHNTAFFYVLFSVFEPYLIGIDRWFHLTSLETYFAFTALLLILYWNKTNKNIHLALSGIFLALSVLSKITTLISLPVYLFVITFKNKENKILLIKALSMYFLFFILTVLILFPAFTFYPFYVGQKLFSAVSSAAFENYHNEQLSYFSRLFFYDLTLFMKLSPITLIMFLGFFANIKNNWQKFENKILLINLGLYYLFLSISEQKIDRYSIAMFPYIILLSSINVDSMKKNIKYALGVLVITYFFISSYFYFPVYSAYNSLLLGGTKTSVNLGVYDNSGEYFAQAALYLNSKGRNINVFVPNGRSSFEYYYKGSIVNQVDSNTNYVVNSIDLTRRSVQNYSCLELEKSFGSKEYDIVFVFKCDE